MNEIQFENEIQKQGQTLNRDMINLHNIRIIHGHAKYYYKVWILGRRFRGALSLFLYCVFKY